MRVAGLDIGGVTTKAVVLNGDGSVIGKSLMAATDEGEAQADKALQEALAGTGLSVKDLDCIVATGAGRKTVSFAHKQKTTQSCLGKGAFSVCPSARLVIDVGAESCIIVKLSDKGTLEDSVSNDHCASGTGIFLETMAKLMRLPLEEFSRQSLDAKSRADISSMCAVFAEQEVISHIHRKPPTPKADVIAGIHASIVSRVVGFAKRLGIKPDVVLTGGVARNVGFARILEETIGMEVRIPAEPEFVGALGAALFAREGKAAAPKA